MFSSFAACLLLVLVTLGVYWPVTNHEFVDYDDGDYVTGNTQVQRGLTWVGVKWAFTTGHASNWHPLTWLSHELDVSVFGKHAGGHHLTSVLIHCANVVLVFLLLKTLTEARWRSVIVAGLFALHPLHVESVAWVSERKDVLSAFFGLLTLWCYAKSKGQSLRSKVFHGAALGCFALGLMCKPMLVTLPFVMLLLDYWPLRRFTLHASQFTRHRLLLEKIPYLALCVASSVVTFLVQRKGRAVSALDGLPIPARIANAVVSYARYLGKTFWPQDLSILYPHPGHWPAWMVGGAVALLVVLTAVAVISRRKLPFVTVGWFWFVGMLVPVIGLVQVGIQSMADRYSYLPSVGLFLAVVWAVAVAAEWRPAFRPVLVGCAAIALAACAAVTWFQLHIWANSEMLFRHAVAATRDNYLAYNNLGFYLSNKGRTAEALTNFSESLRINPNYADAHNNLGHALAAQKKHVEAIEHYRVALRGSPQNLEIHNNLGNSLSEIGRLDEAVAEYRFVLQRNPEHAGAHGNLGIALAMQGQLDEAVTQLEAALRFKPEDASAHGNLGNALAAQKKFPEAILHYRAALRLSPADAQTHNNLGNVLAELGRFEEGITNYNAALRLNADNPEAHFNLGCTLARLNRRAEAAQHFSEALRLKPDYTAAREQLRQISPGANP